MPAENQNPVCQNPRCSHYMVRSCLVEAQQNRCNTCRQPLTGETVKPTARVKRVGKQLRLQFAGLPQYIM